ncbi:hypothetical protein D9M68_699740 [compost metagenome]
MRAGIPGLCAVAGLALEAALAHLPLLAEAGGAPDGETGLLQRPAHEAGGGEGGKGGAGAGEPRQLGEEGGAPHVRVLRRGEAVEEPGVDARVQLGQAVQGIAHLQGEHHAATRQVEALEARVHGDVLLQQLVRERRQFRPEGQGALQVVTGEGEFFHADELQPGIGRRASLEQLPGAEEVQAGTEAGFADGEAAARRQLGEAPGQVVAIEEDVAGLIDARGGGEIDVVEFPGQRLALFVPVESGVVEIGHGGSRDCEARMVAHLG